MTQTNIKSSSNIENNWQLVKVMDVEHTVTAQELTDHSVNPVFDHNLGFKPAVDAYVILSSDGNNRPLPYLALADGVNYYENTDGFAPSLIIAVASISTTQIEIRAVIRDVIGLSVLAANVDLRFKLYFFRAVGAQL